MARDSRGEVWEGRAVLHEGLSLQRDGGWDPDMLLPPRVTPSLIQTEPQPKKWAVNQGSGGLPLSPRPLPAFLSSQEDQTKPNVLLLKNHLIS